MPAVDVLGHLRQIFETLVEGLDEYVRGCADKCPDTRDAHRKLDAHIREKAHGGPNARPDVTTLFYLLIPELGPRDNARPVFARVDDPALKEDVAAIRDTRNKWAHFQPIEFAEAEETARRAMTILRRTAPHHASRLNRLQRELFLRLPVGLAPATPPTDFWGEHHFEFGDDVNEHIWQSSPDLQRSICPPTSLTGPDAVGAQQAMVEGEDVVLPWIPDLLGSRWRDEASILVIGAAYSGIIQDYSTRLACLTLREYRECRGVRDFQSLFLNRVVQADVSYYGYIRALVGTEDASRLAVLDLCRASFVRRGQSTPGPRRDGSPIQAIAADPAEFSRYAEHRVIHEWTWSRIAGTNATRILCVDQAAEHGVLRLFREHGGEIYKQESKWPFELPELTASEWPLLNPDVGHSGLRWATEGGYWKVKLPEGKKWYIRPI